MKCARWSHAALLGITTAWFAGCAEQPPAADTAFSVRKIDSIPSAGNGAVRIKLSTPGAIAEADESMIVQYAQIVAVREATQQQRQIAATRARATYRKIAAQPASHARKARYLAVKTEPSAPGSSSIKSRASVMIWDTHTQEIVGTKVYELGSTPPPRTVARFETYTAEYVGSGL